MFATPILAQEIEVVVPLDNIGISDSKFLNPRRPFIIAPADSLRFDNRTVDREFDVKFNIHADITYTDLAVPADGPSLSWRKERKAKRDAAVKERAIISAAGRPTELNVDPDECTLDIDEGEIQCPARLRVGRLRKVGLLGGFIQQHLHDAIEFTVDFRNDIDEPANSKGYLQLNHADGQQDGDRTKSRDEKLTWTPSASISSNMEPQFPLKEKDEKQIPILSKELPYSGARQQHVAGAAQLELDYILATWADVETTFTFKDGDFGDEEAGTDVSASKYKFKLYNSNGTTFHFGKFDFASPANKIAVNERGEGVLFDFGAVKRMIGNPTLGHIVRRENSTPFGAEDRDAHSTILQWNNIPLGRNTTERLPRALRALRTLNALALYGEDGSNDDPHSYRSYGLEVVGGTTLRQRSIAGSAAHYRSSRTGAPQKRGEGDVTLVRLTLNLLREEQNDAAASHSIQLLLGRGSADNPSTQRIESYVGETQGFAPDTIFLSTLADPLVEGGEVLVGNGLGNKVYAGVQYTTDRVSPLEWLAKFADMAQIVESKSTTVSLHAYRFRGYTERPRNAGWEADVEFALEGAKGIKTTVGFAYFAVGDALEVQLPQDLWAVTVGISVEP